MTNSSNKLVYKSNGHQLWVALSAIYSDSYNQWTDLNSELIKGVLRTIDSYVKMGTQKVEVHLQPIRDRRGFVTEGRQQARLGGSKLTIDPRSTPSRMLRTLAHEMVHAEQWAQGRLQYDFILRSYLWEGKPHTHQYRTVQQYRQLPWEREAFGRELSIAIDMADQIGFEFDLDASEQQTKEISKRRARVLRRGY